MQDYSPGCLCTPRSLRMAVLSAAWNNATATLPASLEETSFYQNAWNGCFWLCLYLWPIPYFTHIMQLCSIRWSLQEVNQNQQICATSVSTSVSDKALKHFKHFKVVCSCVLSWPVPGFWTTSAAVHLQFYILSGNDILYIPFYNLVCLKQSKILESQLWEYFLGLNGEEMPQQ